ncbi:MAG: substrate-binding domain-containing protein, partial [Ruminococcus sp.]|nr:substrate-binding domain-containing protein [Ruminococcus sp.]
TESGIPVVTLNSDIAGRGRLAYVGCDLLKSGRVMAELLSMFVRDRECNVAMILGSEKNAGMKARMNGFQNYIAENQVNFRIVHEIWTDEGVEMVYEKTLEILHKPERIDYICVMGGGVSGCMRAIRESQQALSTRVLTYDLIDEVKAGMREGIVAASITQDPEQQGYLAYQLIAKYLAFGQNPQEDVNYTNLAVKLRSCL